MSQHKDVYNKKYPNENWYLVQKNSLINDLGHFTRIYTILPIKSRWTLSQSSVYIHQWHCIQPSAVYVSSPLLAMLAIRNLVIGIFSTESVDWWRSVHKQLLNRLTLLCSYLQRCTKIKLSISIRVSKNGKKKSIIPISKSRRLRQHKVQSMVYRWRHSRM